LTEIAQKPDLVINNHCLNHVNLIGNLSTTKPHLL
jgi:hypothetical protein